MSQLARKLIVFLDGLLAEVEPPSSVVPGMDQLLAEVTGIDAKVAARTLIYTPGFAVDITRMILIVTAAVSITSPPKIGLGIAAAEIFSVTTCHGLTALTKRQHFVQQGSTIEVLEDDTVDLDIDTAAVGTSMTLTARIYGIPEIQ